jgi:uncharacterized protein with von Willebrand factor type A (vWA) domain
MSDKQTHESMLKTWSETQQKLLTNWLDTLRKLGGAPTLELWTKTIDAWQASVKETVDARAEFARQWAETLANARGTPEEFRELARKEREEMQQWTEAERELWKGWFNVVRHINFRPEPGAGAKAERNLVDLWQESAHKMIDAQAALVRRWTGGTSRTKKQE